MTSDQEVIDVRFVFQEILKTKESRSLIKLAKVNVTKYLNYIEECGAANWIIESPEHYLVLSEEFLNEMEKVMTQNEFEEIMSYKDMINDYVYTFLQRFV